MALDLTKFAGTKTDTGNAFDKASQGGYGGSAAPTKTTDVVNLSSLDFSKKRQRPLWPLGTYDAAVKDCQYVKSKTNAHNWNFRLSIEVFDQEGKTQTQYYYLGFMQEDGVTLVHEDALIRLGKTILTINPDFDMSSVSAESVPEGLIGRPCRVKLKVGELYNDEHKNEISDIMPAAQDF